MQQETWLDRVMVIIHDGKREWISMLIILIKVNKCGKWQAC